MTVTVAGIVHDVTGRRDPRSWKVHSPVYRQGTEGAVVNMRTQLVSVPAGVFSVEVEPGVTVFESPDGDRWTVTVPEVDSDLWDVLAAAVAFPDETAADAIGAAIASWIATHPDAALVSDFDPRLDDTRTPTDGSVTTASLEAGLATELGVRGSASTVTAAGTTTLTIASEMLQIFTGTTTQTVKLPTTSVTAGLQYVVINQSSGDVTVQSSGSNTIVVLKSGKAAFLTAVVDAPTAAAHWSVVAPSAAAQPFSTVARDANGNVVADNFLASSASTVTAAGTTTLAVDSPQVQIFTGSTTQTCQLPTTGVVAGQKWVVINQSSLYDGVTVNSSDGTLVSTVRGPNRVGEFIALVDTPTAGSHWWPVAVNTSATALTVAMRDSQNKLLANSFMLIPQYTLSSGGTTTLDIQDGQVRVVYGGSNHTLKLPSGSIQAGWIQTVINQSSGTVTVQSSGANTITTVAASSAKRFLALINAPTTDAHWQVLS